MQNNSIDILQDILSNLTWSDIPSDLSEIDTNWCYNRLFEYCAGEVREHLKAVTYDDMDFMTCAFKDLLNEAIADEPYHTQYH
jgi:hypothetical protein